MRMPLSEFRAFQRILVQYNDEEYSIWSGAKGWPEEFSEFGGEAPLNLCCELSDEAERIELENINCEFISTSCKWNLASTLDESIAL